MERGVSVLHWDRSRYVLLRKGVIVAAYDHDGVQM